MWRSSPSVFFKKSLNEYNVWHCSMFTGVIHVNIGTYWHVGHVRKCKVSFCQRINFSLDIKWNLVGGGIQPQSVNSCFFSMWSELIFHSHNVKLMSRWEGGNSVVSKPKHSRWRVPTSDITVQRVLNFFYFYFTTEVSSEELASSPAGWWKAAAAVIAFLPVAMSCLLLS